MFKLRRASSFFNKSKNCFNCPWAPTKLVPLSEYMHAGLPLRAENRLSAAMNALDVRSLTSSMWIALVAKHTKIDTYALLSFALRLLSRKISGPA